MTGRGYDGRRVRSDVEAGGSELRQQKATLAVWRLAAVALLAVTTPVNAGAQSSRPGTDSPDKTPQSIWERDSLMGDWGGLRTHLEDAGVKFKLQEQSEVWGNLAGGLRRGAVYTGLTTGSVTLDLEKLIGWQGATFYANAFQIHGRGPSSNLVGNLQFVSNIEATRDTKLFGLWLEQSLFGGKLNIRLGQEGANDEMMTSQYGAVFLNSSFGFPGLPAADLPSGGPNYPLASPFVRVKYQPNDQITLMGAVFNGDPAPAGSGDPQLRDRGGTAFRVNDHVLAFGEIWYSINQDAHDSGLPGTYKLGVWVSSAHFSDQVLDTMGVSLANPASSGIPRAHSTGFAIYGIVDQMVWRRPGTGDQGIGVFLQVMGAPGDFNVSNLFVEGGINWKGPFPGRESDVFGIGVSYLGISPAARKFSRDVLAFTGAGSPYRANETVIELTYQYQIAPWLTLQPDAQYVINPGAGITTAASHTTLSNDFVVGLRANVTF